MRGALWRWPHSLSGRMACILIAGLFAAQALTSTIWFDRRRNELLDVPLRILAVRVADTMKLFEGLSSADRERIAAHITDPAFHAKLLRGPPGDLPTDQPRSQTERLFASIVQARYGSSVQTWVQEMELLGDKGQPAGTWSMLDAQAPTVRYNLIVHVPGRAIWLQVQGMEGENGADTHRLGTIADYFLRIYLARILIVILIALIAVRLAMQPLARMAQAAEALGTDINSPPLETDGPVEVHRAAEAFNRMQRRLKETLAERSRFLAAVSHDLRSPITRLRLRVELLPDEIVRDKFRRELADMEALIDATLSFVQSGEGHGLRTQVDIDLLIGDICRNMGDLGALVTVSGQSLGPMIGFKLSLQRCFQNIIENAVRYAGSAHVEILDSSRELVISITDEGPGIPAHELDKVFEPFYRLEESRSVDTGGFGLGLSIAGAVVAAHGGTLNLANRIPQGLEARIILPRSR